MNLNKLKIVWLAVIILLFVVFVVVNLISIVGSSLQSSFVELFWQMHLLSKQIPLLLQLFLHISLIEQSSP